MFATSVSVGPFFLLTLTMEAPLETQEATINTGESSPSVQSSSEDLISTVELPIAMDADESPEGGAKPEESDDQSPAEGKEAEGAESKSEEGKPSDKDDSTRFDKHPRFVELNTRVKTAEAQNQQLLESIAELKASIKESKTQGNAPSEELPYKDTSKMTSEELLDWQAEDPQGYADNLRQEMNYRIQQGIDKFKSDFESLTEEQTEKQRIMKTFESYTEKNPDFQELWDSGAIEAYTDANPGHNAISAHLMLTAEARQAEAVEKAVKEALEKRDAEAKAKRKATVLGSGPTSVPATGSDAELKEPQKHGGATSVLASRLAARRAG